MVYVEKFKGENFGRLSKFYPPNILTNGIISFYISCSGAVAIVFPTKIVSGMNH